MPEHTVLISMRVSPPCYVVPGSLQVKCADCGELVWVSPSSWLMMHDNPDTEILCNECGLIEPGEVQLPTPAQLGEIREYLENRLKP